MPPRDSHLILERRNARARAQGYRSYGQKRYWQRLHNQGRCLGCRAAMPPETDPQRTRSKLCDVCNLIADPRGIPRAYGWQARYERLMAFHRRRRGMVAGWGSYSPTRADIAEVAQDIRAAS